MAKRSSDCISPPEKQPNHKFRSVTSASMDTEEAAILDTKLSMEDIRKKLGEAPQWAAAMLDIIITEFNVLKNTVKVVSSRYDKLEAEHVTLTNKYDKDVQMLTDNVEQLKSENGMLREKLVTQESYSRQQNLVFSGVPECDNENLTEIFESIARDKLNLRHHVKLEDIHRIGRPRENFSRPFIVRFSFRADRMKVWESKGKLKRTGIYINQDYSREEQAVRKKLLPVMYEARRQNMKAELEGTNLKINGKIYTKDTLHLLDKEVRDGSRWTNDQVSFFGGLCPASNFHPAKFTVDGINHTFLHNEQFIMYKKAMKFGDKLLAQQILRETEPSRCKGLGYKVKGFDQAVWEASIEEEVLPGLKAKFSQNQHLLDWLKSTGVRRLVEATETDSVWGIGLPLRDDDITDPAKWDGKNLQGIMLTKVRQELCFEEF